jgi:hypothetical protein
MLSISAVIRLHVDDEDQADGANRRMTATAEIHEASSETTVTAPMSISSQGGVELVPGWTTVRDRNSRS